MQCPVCGKEMVTKNFGVEVDVCENGCKGMWFDHGELAMLDEKNEGLGAALQEALKYPRSNEGRRGQIKCPKCGIPMHAHKYQRAKEVNVDECYGCGGFFLDSGELAEIRDHYMSDAEVQAYADQMINAVPGYAQEVNRLDAEKNRLDAIRRFTGVLSLHYWGL
jgi:Zn-finger nucleic acid-binding protein